MGEKTKKVMPYYCTGVLWILYAVIFRLDRFLDYTILITLSAIVFILFRAEKSKDIEVEGKEEKKETKKESTGNPELDAMMEDGEKYILQLKELDVQIEDERISGAIVLLEDYSQKIFEQVKAKPDKLPDIKKFMNYYLPTTIKLLTTYASMANSGTQGENVTNTLKKIDGMMDTIVTAFAKQLDLLYGEEALDISTDITVFENILNKEGLTANNTDFGTSSTITL